MSISNSFVPNRQQVSAITNANPAVVTTTEVNGYETGLYIRFFFPLDVGMNNLDGKVFKITVIDDTNFSIPIDSRFFDVFSPVGSVQVPEVIPVGEVSEILSMAAKNNENIIPET